MFEGCLTALVTPFRGRGRELDLASLNTLVEWQIAEGVEGLIACGTTGEAATLTSEEQDLVIRTVVAAARGKVPILAGTGSNCTRRTIAQTQAARVAGADAALIVTPYYNKPTQEGLFDHFAVVASTVDLPVVLYNVPSRTGVDLSIGTIARLMKFPAIVGIKDATGDLSRPPRLAAEAGSQFRQLCGADATMAAFNLAGGHGCISVVANVAPRWVRELQDACRGNDFARAQAIQSQLSPLIDALERETNPICIKTALSLSIAGFDPAMRLPLTQATDETRRSVAAALETLGVPRIAPEGVALAMAQS